MPLPSCTRFAPPSPSWYTDVDMAGLDPSVVRHALQTARSRGYLEVEISLGENHFSATLMRTPKSMPTPASAAEPETPALIDVKSPCVGYFRFDRKPLTLGESVEAGSTIATVAALGLANDVEAPATGTLVELLVEPEQAVEFGQVLARIRAPGANP